MFSLLCRTNASRNVRKSRGIFCRFFFASSFPGIPWSAARLGIAGTIREEKRFRTCIDPGAGVGSGLLSSTPFSQRYSHFPIGLNCSGTTECSVKTVIQETIPNVCITKMYFFKNLYYKNN
jgi:hypothetical protein